MPKTPIIEYTNILHAHGKDSDEAEAFKRERADDALFQKRAATLDKLFLLKPDPKMVKASREAHERGDSMTTKEFMEELKRRDQVKRREARAEAETLHARREESDEGQGSCGCPGGDCS